MPGNNSERNLRKKIIQIIRLTYEKGYIAASDGNVSARLGPNLFLCTPTGLHKGLMTEEDLVVVDDQGKKVRGKYKASSEMAMHLKAYEMRPDIQAVVHAHPPIVTAFSVAGVSLQKAILPESIFVIGEIRFAEYSTPTTDAVPRAIESLIRDYDALILTRHGSLTVGETVDQAYMRLESLEHTAKIISEAMKIGAGKRIPPLPDEEIEKLWKIKEEITGVGRPGQQIAQGASAASISEEEIANIVRRLVKESLSKQMIKD